MPKRDFGSNFLGGFQQTFNPTFQNVLDNLMQEKRQQKIMDEQNRRELEKEQKETQQRKTVMDLMRGSETLNIPQGLTPVLPQGINKEVPYSQEQTLEKLGSLDTGGLQYYNAVRGLLTPEQQKTVTVDGKVYRESPYYKGVPEGDAIYEFPEEFKKEIKTNWNLKRTEGGKIIVPKGYYDKEGTWIETDFKMITPTQPKKTDYGKSYTDLTKETKKELNDYYNRQQDIKAKLDAVRQGVTVYDTNFFGVKFKLSESDLLNQLSEVNGEYTNYISNTEPSTVVAYRNDFNKKYGEVKPSDADDLFNYYAEFYNDYKNSKIEPSEYLYLLNDFRAKYGFDPATKFNTALDAGR